MKRIFINHFIFKAVDVEHDAFKCQFLTFIKIMWHNGNYILIGKATISQNTKQLFGITFTSFPLNNFSLISPVISVEPLW